MTYLPNSSTGYVQSVVFDAIGRVAETRDAVTGNVGSSGTRLIYNEYGYNTQVIDLVSGDVLSRTLETNARGQVTRQLRNNGGAGTQETTYDERTGVVKRNYASVGSAFPIQEINYEWDLLGNLKSRWNQSSNLAGSARKNLQESFCYDGLNRLIKSHQGTLYGSCNLALQDQDVEYSGLGNINRKAGVGVYSYSGKGPHAVTYTSADGAYDYDNNGNQISGAGRSLSYSSYDQVLSITKNGMTTEFKYGPHQQRYERIDTKNGLRTVTHYLGNVERIEVMGSNVVEWKRNVAGAIYTLRTSVSSCGGALCYALQSTNKSFIYSDHLGSLDVVVNHLGQVTHSASVDAWGARRSGETWGSFSASSLNLSGFTQPITTKGFTGHEMLDDFNIIHMNGRIYDSRLGRFLQADPNIDGVTHTQGYNRYSYVHNNPLNATDPTGFFSMTQLIGGIAKNFGLAIGVAATIYCAGTCTPLTLALIGATSGATQNFIQGGSLIESVVKGAFSGVVGGLGGGGFTGAVIGGAVSVAQGGEFGHGFISAYISSFVPHAGDFLTDIMIQSIVGGAISEATGGKFKNGAASAAFAFAVSWAASKIGAGGVEDYHDLSTDGPLGPERFTDEQKKEFKRRLEEALKTQPKEGFANDIEALEWFKENIFPIVNQGDVPGMDFEVASTLAPLNSLNGRYKFLNVETNFYNHMVCGGCGNLHTHQTTSFFSGPDQEKHVGADTNRYLVNDRNFYKFRGHDYWSDVTKWRASGKVGSAPNSSNYYQQYVKDAGWLDL